MCLGYYTKLFLNQQFKKFRKNPLPNSLIYFVTNKCNSNCKGCFYWDSLNKRTEELGLEEVEKISQSLNKVSHLLISGGEPFLRKDLVQICNIFINQNGTEKIDIPTNGLLSNTIFKETLKLLENNRNIVLNVSLPLDGLEETTDYLRGEGSFKKIMHTISLLNKLMCHFSNLFLTINTTVSNKNHNEIRKISEFVKDECNVSMHNIGPIRGELKTKSLKSISQKEWVSFLKFLQENKSYYLSKNYSFIMRRIKLSVYKHEIRTIANALKGEKWPFKCVAGNSIGVLEPDGGVRLCELTRKIGNLRCVDYDFKKVWYSHEANKLREGIKAKNCTSGCTHSCFLIPSLTYSPYKFFTS